MWLNYLTYLFFQHFALESLSFNPAFLSRWNTYSSRDMWPSKSLATTIMPFGCGSRLCQCKPRNTLSISLWNVAGAEVWPNGRTFHCYSPERAPKVDFSPASVSSSTCQYSLVKFNMLKKQFLAKASRLSSILEIGYALWGMTLLVCDNLCRTSTTHHSFWSRQLHWIWSDLVSRVESLTSLPLLPFLVPIDGQVVWWLLHPRWPVCDAPPTGCAQYLYPLAKKTSAKLVNISINLFF